jgi:hypothetical protein
LKNMMVEWNIPPKIGMEWMENIQFPVTLHVPAGAADAYRNDEEWGKFNVVEAG